MKQVIMIVFLIWFCITPYWAVEANQVRRQRSLQQKKRQPQTATPPQESQESQESHQQQEQNRPPVQKGFKTSKEQLEFLKGQKVVILPHNPFMGSPLWHARLRSLSKPDEEVRLEAYAGKTGIITDIVKGNEGLGSMAKFVITLENSDEKIEATTENFGFLALKDIMHAYVGIPVWAKGKIALVKNWTSGMSDEQKKAQHFLVENTKKLILTSRMELEYGDRSGNSNLVLCFKTDTGQEGCATFAIDPRFSNVVYPLWYDLFYFDDPHKHYPNWSRNIWKLVENEEVAIGMTEDMVRLACSGGIDKYGVDISASDSAPGVIYRGCNRKFLIVNGKVTKYVD